MHTKMIQIAFMILGKLMPSYIAKSCQVFHSISYSKQIFRKEFNVVLLNAQKPIFDFSVTLSAHLRPV